MPTPVGAWGPCRLTLVRDGAALPITEADHYVPGTPGNKVQLGLGSAAAPPMLPCCAGVTMVARGSHTGAGPAIARNHALLRAGVAKWQELYLVGAYRLHPFLDSASGFDTIHARQRRHRPRSFGKGLRPQLGGIRRDHA